MALDINDADSKVVHVYVVTSDYIDIVKGTPQWQVGDKWQLGKSFPVFRCSYNFLVKPDIVSFFYSLSKELNSRAGLLCAGLQKTLEPGSLDMIFVQLFTHSHFQAPNFTREIA